MLLKYYYVIHIFRIENFDYLQNNNQFSPSHDIDFF